MKSHRSRNALSTRKRTADTTAATPARRNKVAPLARQLPARSKAGKFDEILSLFAAARQRAYHAVNTELVGLYWELGGYISRKIASAEWGDGVVDEMAATIAREYPGQRGFTRANLFRMRQFFEAYRDDKKVAPLVRQLPWTQHLILLGRTKHPEEREFYLLAAIQGRWSKRELERQIRTGASLRSLPAAKKVSPQVAQIHPTAVDEFKSIYKLNFYLEALDCDVKKPHERPSIGVLLCASKDNEVVEYALSRSLSPTLVAEYQTVLPSKSLLRRKLHELYAQLAPQTDGSAHWRNDWTSP